MEHERLLVNGLLLHLSKLPALSDAEIEETISAERKLIFRLIYKHIPQETLKTLKAEEVAEIKNFKLEASNINALLLMAFFGHIDYFDYISPLVESTGQYLLDLIVNPNQLVNADKLLNPAFFGYLDYKDAYGSNALIYAVQGGNIHMLNHLLNLGFDRKSFDLLGGNLLLHASLGGHILMFEHLLKLGFDLKSTNKNGASAFLYACTGCSIEMCEYLLTLGFNINDVDIYNNNAMLYGFSQFSCITPDNMPLLKHLLKLGLDRNHSNIYGYNALSCPLLLKNVEATMELLRIGVSDENAVYSTFDTLEHAKKRLRNGRINLIAFKALTKLIVGVVKQRYWSPSGDGFQQAHKRFTNRLLTID